MSSVARSPLLVGALLACALLPTGLPAQAGSAAAAALAAGRPWQATQLLRPVLADQTRTSAAHRLLAARAAAAWSGWTEVDRLLATPEWAGHADEAEVRGLLGRAALARRADGEAADHLRVALHREGTDRRRGTYHALLARALDRLDQRDSAAVHYRAAAARLPSVADWLHLRAAGVTADSATRQRLYQQVRLPAAVARVAWTEAAALERLPDPGAAARKYTQLGAPIPAARAWLAGSPTTAERARIRATLLDVLGRGENPADTREAIALLAGHFTPLTIGEQLRVARRAAAIGDRDRAARGFAAARQHPELTDRDRLAWGAMLAQSGRHAEAIPLLASVRDPDVAGAAAYQRARSLLSRPGNTAALPVLREIPTRWPHDTASAAVALFLAGDLLADAGDWGDARASYQRVAVAYPTTPYAARALLEVGTIAYAAGDRSAALAAFAEAAARHRNREEGSAGEYWAGRIEAERGDTAAARGRWRAIIARVPHSYYALAAARRLGEPVWAPVGGDAPFVVGPALQAAVARADLLGELGLEPERLAELDAISTRADSSLEVLLETAQALRDHGHTARALALAQRALARGAPRTVALYRLLFPLPDHGLLESGVLEQGVDPWFVAGLIKQESGFDPRARSAADARGLMQVMPAVGRQLARELGWREWDTVLLYEPEVSLMLGGRHLAAMLRRHPDPVRTLAAYNAGGTRVQRWAQRPGVAEDPELFLERIPYLETRNYVRRVLRNVEFYRALYGGDRRVQ